MSFDWNTAHSDGEDPVWEKKLSPNLQRAKQLLESPSTHSRVQTLYHLAKTKGYCILRDALEEGLTDVATEMLKFGARVNNRSGKAVDSPLHLTVFQENKEMVQLLLSKGARINAKNKTGETPLLLAVKDNTIDIVRLLVTNKADVNATNNEGVTPLHCTVPPYCSKGKGDKTGEIARLLLSAGANVNAETTSKQTTLQVAVDKGYTEVVKALLEFKADVNVCAGGLETLLFQSVDKGNADLTQIFLDNGAQVNARSTRDMRTPLQRAVKNRSESIVKVLLSMPDIEVDLKTNEGETAFHIAAVECNENIVRALVEKGADVNVTDNRGRLALHVALEGQAPKTDFLSLLLTCHTNINSRDHDKKTLLHYAVKREHVAFISVLLDHGAEVNLTDHLGRAPLHYAAVNALRDSALPLLKRGANINLRDNDGNTPLHLAVNTNRTKEYDTVLALLEYGAETNLKDNSGKTPLHVAFKNRLVSRKLYLEITDSLLARGAIVNVKDDDGKTPLHYAAENFVPEKSSLSNILKYGADVNAVDNKGKTALHIASSWFWERNMTELLENGADADMKDVNGKTPLHIAVEHGRAEYIHILMYHMVQRYPKDNTGKTPLHYAAKNCREEVNVLYALLRRGADVNSKDNLGKTPFQIALDYGVESNVLILMNHGADTKVKDDSGKTLLHYASKGGMKYVLYSFLKRGHNVNAKDIEGKTPLYVCAEAGYRATGYNHFDSEVDFCENITENGHCAIASVLLAHGADVDCMDKYGKTVLYLAAEKDRLDVVKALLKYGANVNVLTNNFAYYRYLPLKGFFLSRAVKEELQEHIVMLRALNLPVDEMNLQSIDFNSSRVKEFQSRCENEICRSKEVTLVEGDKIITFYDILTKHRINLYLFLRSGISSDVSNSFMYQLYNFRIFRNMIDLNFRLAVERVPLIQEATVLLGDLFSIPPGICVDAITDYLRNGDLKSFVTACRSTDE